MLSATIELWPHGDQSRSKRLVTIALANVGRNSDGTSDYIYTLDEPEPLFGNPVDDYGKLSHYDRKNNCIEILDAVLSNWKFRGGPPMLDSYEQDIVDILKAKEKP